VAAGLGVTIYPESLIGFLGRNVEVRRILHPDFRIQTVLAWKRVNRANPCAISSTLPRICLCVFDAPWRNTIGRVSVSASVVDFD